MICRQLLIRHLGRLRVGQAGGAEEACAPWLPADTLFSALCHAIRSVWGLAYLEDFLKQMDTSQPPALLLTAGYPCLFDDPDDPLYFLPKPLHHLPPDPAREFGGEWAKALKRTQLIPAQAFVPWVSGKPIQLATIAAARERLAKHVAFEINARTALDRVSQNSHLFFLQALRFSSHAGLYALALASEETWELLIPALRWLEESGLGGERTLGFGHCRISITEPPAWYGQLPSYHGGPFCTLSAFAPQPEELPELIEGADFQILEKSGWSQSPGWSGLVRRYRLFIEGSCFRRPAQGRLLDVTPANAPHPVYRYAFAFPISLQEG